MVKKKDKLCRHKFIHLSSFGRCANKEDKKIYEWLIHKCIKCGKISNGEKLENE